MIRPVEITNAGTILFQIAFLVTIKTVLRLPFWLEFMFTAALLLSITGTAIYAFELPAKWKAKKRVSLQEACQAHHVSYFRTKANVGAKWSDAFTTVMVSSREFYSHMNKVRA